MSVLDTSPAAEAEFLRLDPRVVVLWRLSSAIGFGLPLVAALVACAVAWAIRPELLLPAAAATVVLAALFAWGVAVRPGRAYRAWGYRIDDRVLELRSGVVFQVSQLLPLARLQHVDLRRGPLERSLGLASLALHTAGTREATLHIPGLDSAAAARLRDHLVAVGGDDAV
jgi:membrane protein YdbS with pleckstrin-like domain